MSHEIFLLPDVGEGLIEAEIVAWKVGVGDTVVLNQPLVDVETAKAVVELPSPYAGTVVTLHGQVGDTMEVNTPLVTFDVGGRRAAQADEEQRIHAVPDEQRREPVLIGYGVASEDGPPARRNRRSPATAQRRAPEALAVSEPEGGLVRTTPPVRLLAKQYGVDLALVAPTGPDGRVTRDDVEGARRGSQHTPRGGYFSSESGATSRFVGRDIDAWSVGAREERIPVKGVLKAMAESMVRSSTRQPQAAVWTRVDATKTMELLTGLKNNSDFPRVRLSPLTIVALAVCDAARHFPGINSSFDDENNDVIVRRYVNLGIAADTPRGLVVPNIKDADRLDVMGMAEELSRLVETARSGTTTPNDMLGTTFTITNVGPFGVDGAMAMLPPGTGAIVCVGKIAKSPWVVDDIVVVRHVAELSMTFDHRHIDGALASQVISHIGRFLEDPATALLVRRLGAN